MQKGECRSLLGYGFFATEFSISRVQKMLSQSGCPRIPVLSRASGSTWQFRDRFFGVARSLPADKFRVELCSFDTRVFPLNMAHPALRGGGGTSFEVLEAWLLARTDPSKSVTYPDVVIVLTDGDGDFVEPAHPERWHWLLTSTNVSCIPKGSVILRLSDYV